jgi:hypothetical protein
MEASVPLFRWRPKTAVPPTPQPSPPPAADTAPGSDPPPALPIDPACGDPDSARLRDALAAADWPTARHLLDGRDPDHLAFMLDMSSSVPGPEQWLPDVIRADLRDTLTPLMYGARVVDWAWDARTGARAKNVGRDQFAVFHERLRLAEDCLQDVVRREPDNTAGWYQLLLVARGLELGEDEAKHRFDQIIARHPTHLRAHLQMLQQLCRKWGGSHEKMHAFAREAAAAAPAGSPLGLLIVYAHIEEWLDLGSEGRGYFKSPEVIASIHAAADRSVRHPDYRPQPGWPTVHNPFAMAFCLAGEHAAAAQQFRVIGDHVTRMPWTYLKGKPGATFLARRTTAYAAVS